MSLSKTRFCVPCRKTEDEVPIFVCSKCKIFTYCSKSCQRANFKRHKAPCEDLKFLEEASNHGLNGLTLQSEVANELRETCYGEGPVRTKLFADLKRARLLFDHSVMHQLFHAMEMYNDIMNGWAFYFLSDPSVSPQVGADMIFGLMEVGRIDDALKLHTKLMQDNHGYLKLIIAPKLWVAELSLWFVMWNRVRCNLESFKTFVSELGQAPNGSSARKLHNVSLVLDNMLPFVLGEDHHKWKVNYFEEIIRERLQSLFQLKTGILEALITPVKCPCRHSASYNENPAPAFGNRIIQRLPWAVEYIKVFLSERKAV